MVLNETVNATIQNLTIRSPLPSISTPLTDSLNGITSAILQFFISKAVPRFIEVVTVPFNEPGVFWIVIPLIISMVLMQLYFGRHREEELGWNTAFGNSIALIFVSMNLLQFLYNKFGWATFDLINPPSYKIWLVIGIGTISLVQLIINYFHAIPKRIAFFINSSIPTNMTAYIAIVLVYTQIPLDWATFIASIALLILLIYVFKFVRELTPMTETAEQHVERLKRQELKRKLYLEKLELRQARAADAVFKDAFIMFFANVWLVVGLILFEMFVVKNNLDVFWTIPLIQGLFMILMAVIYLKKRNLKIYNLNYDGEVKEWLIGIIFGFAAMVVYGLINLFLSTVLPELPKFYFKDTMYNILIAFIGNVIVLPLGAELLYRGAIQRSLKARMRKRNAIITQSLMFLINGINLTLLNNPVLYLGFISTFVMGIILGYLRDKWGLESAISTHITINAIGTLFWLKPLF